MSFSKCANRRAAGLGILFAVVLSPAAFALIAQTPAAFRGEYFCSGGRSLSVTALIEIHFVDNHHVELVFSGVRKPIHFPTTYRVNGDRMYIQHDRDAVFAFKIDGATLVGLSYPYKDRRCSRDSPAAP